MFPCKAHAPIDGYLICGLESGHYGPHRDPDGLVEWSITDAGRQLLHERAADRAYRESPAGREAEERSHLESLARMKRDSQEARERFRHAEIVAIPLVKEWLQSGAVSIAWRPPFEAPEISYPAGSAHVWLPSGKSACKRSDMRGVQFFDALPEGAKLCGTCAMHIAKKGHSLLPR